MTCIIGIEHKGKVYVGGDSASVANSNLTIDAVTTPKVFVRDGYIMGYTTSWRMGQILHHCGRLPKPPCKPTIEELDAFMVKKFISRVRKIFEKEGFVLDREEIEHGSGAFLVGVHGRLYTVHTDWQCVHQIRGWDAIGCGEQFALGSLYATYACKDWKIETRIREALKAAAYYSAGVIEPFLVRAL